MGKNEEKNKSPVGAKEKHCHPVVIVSRRGSPNLKGVGMRGAHFENREGWGTLFLDCVREFKGCGHPPTSKAGPLAEVMQMDGRG